MFKHRLQRFKRRCRTGSRGSGTSGMKSSPRTSSQRCASAWCTPSRSSRPSRRSSIAAQHSSSSQRPGWPAQMSPPPTERAPVRKGVRGKERGHFRRGGDMQGLDGAALHLRHRKQHADEGKHARHHDFPAAMCEGRWSSA
eukprot:scaffold8711_cov63-Phaeocystis_antarctica.AAC.6